ncbi:MAG: SDR family oxidoreductase [Geminicoccaceae bacterium]
MSLDGTTILVIGGTSGIGLATARRLAEGGAQVTVAGRDPDRLRRASAELPARIRGEQVDFTDEASLTALYARLGRLDHLVLCASSDSAWGAFTALETVAVRRYFDRKFWGYWSSIRLVLPILAASGSILMVGGAASRAALPGTAALAAANGALESLTRTLAAELAPRRINLVAPGLVDTDAYAAMPDAQRQAFYADAASKLPVGRIGTPADIADVIVAVLANGFMTGSIVDVDGGVRLARS